MSRLLSVSLLVLVVSVCSCSATIGRICLNRPTTVLSSLSGLLDLLNRLVPNVANLGLQAIPDDCVSTLLNNLTAILDQATNLSNPVIQSAVGILRGLLATLGGVV